MREPAAASTSEHGQENAGFGGGIIHYSQIGGASTYGIIVLVLVTRDFFGAGRCQWVTEPLNSNV